MEKIKLNLVSGAIVEKPLINAFKANNMSYVVLDNEMNGSMGLPIILVCKLENNKLVKINDQNEWQIVKEYLKNIIAGNQVEFLKVPKELHADDIYYTQLSLPVPSFDALKNSYKVEDMEVSAPSNDINNPNNMESASILDINPSAMNNVGVEPAINIPNNSVPPVEPAINVVPSNEPNVMPNPEPIMDPNSSAGTPNNPVIDIVNPVNMESPVTDIPQNSPIPDPITNVQQNSEPIVNGEKNIFSEQKEAFMQACENMFDALVQKFEKELENSKKAE